MTLEGNNVITLRKLTSKATAEKGMYPFNNLEWQVFCFLKGQIPRFSVIVVFSVFWAFIRNIFCRTLATSESAEIGMVGLSIPHS